MIFLYIQAALGLNIKYKEVSALTGEGVEDVSYYDKCISYSDSHSQLGLDDSKNFT